MDITSAHRTGMEDAFLRARHAAGGAALRSTRPRSRGTIELDPPGGHSSLRVCDLTTVPFSAGTARLRRKSRRRSRGSAPRHRGRFAGVSVTDSLVRNLNALIGCSDEWMCRSLQSVFEEKGYTATREGSGKKVLKEARRGVFDVIVLDEPLDDLPAVDVCVALRDDPLFDHATPIVVTSSAHATPKTRAAALAAGAWDYCTQPLDVDGLFMKLETFLRARRELAVAQAQCLMDPASGLYTAFGLQQVSEQLGARALRRHEGFACVAVSSLPADKEISTDQSKSDDGDGFAEMASVVREQMRKSDVIAQTGASRLAIIAPDTDAAGVRLLVARFQRALDEASKDTTLAGRFRLRAGYCAVADLATANLNLTELVERAERALDRVSTGTFAGGIAGWEELPLA